MKKFEKIFFSMIAMIMMVAVGSVFTSCSNDDDGFRVPVQESQFDQALGQDSIAPMTRGVTAVSLVNFGTSVTNHTLIKSGTYVNLYKYDYDNIYIAEVNLTGANIGLIWGTPYTPSTYYSYQYTDAKAYNRKYVYGFVQNETECFLAFNFSFFDLGNYVPTYPFTQAGYVEPGGHKTWKEDYTNYNLFTMVFNQGYGVKLDSFTGSDRANFGTNYSGQKAYVVRNGEGNNPDGNARRTILAFTTKSGSYYRRMYVLISKAQIKEGANDTEAGSAKKYLKNFISAKEGSSVSVQYCPLDGGSSTQMECGNSTYSFQGGRKVINVMIVKD